MTQTSAPEPSAIESLDGRSRAWRHAFVYLWLTYAAISAFVDERGAAAEQAAAVALTVALAGWYWWWQIRGTTKDHHLPDRGYLLGGLVIWAALIALNPTFLLVGVSLLAPYCFDKLRWALVVLAPVAGLWLWQQYQSGDGLGWFDVVVGTLVIASGALCTGYVASLSRQNAERQRLIEELRAAQDELAAAEREAGVLAERQRLARDIHDTLTQGFASIVMLLEAAEASLGAGQPAAPHVASALRTARENLAESRQVVWALRPDNLEGERLPEAVRALMDRLEAETGVRAELVVTGDPQSLSPEIETTILRISQEALANVRKHARASQVTVTLSYMAGMTVLDVQDDGVGFPPDLDAAPGPAGGLGLPAMRERAEELGGRLIVESAVGEGTTVSVHLPETSPSEDDAAAADETDSSPGDQESPISGRETVDTGSRP